MKIKPLLAGLACLLVTIVIFVMVTAPGGSDDPSPVTVTSPETPAVTEPEEEPAVPEDTQDDEYVEYTFRNERLLEDHYYKHGIDMGFDSEEEYQQAASDVANDPEALHKLEKEDGDDVYYKEETNEFVVVSKDGFIRTYFCPDSGKKYFDKQ